MQFVVKIGSLERALIHHNQCPSEKENGGHKDMHLGRMSCEHEDDLLQVKERGLKQILYAALRRKQSN